MSETGNGPTAADLQALLDEMSLGAKDKTRTIGTVSNANIKKILGQAYERYSKRGVLSRIGFFLLNPVGEATQLLFFTIVKLWLQKKNKEEKELLKQEVIEKQNTIIRELKRELEQLKEKYGKAVEQNERYKYIVSLLMSNDEVKKAFGI